MRSSVCCTSMLQCHMVRGMSCCTPILHLFESGVPFSVLDLNFFLSGAAYNLSGQDVKPWPLFPACHPLPPPPFTPTGPSLLSV